MSRILPALFVAMALWSAVFAVDLPPREEIISRQADLSFSLNFDATLRQLKISPEAKALLLEIAQSPAIHERIKYSSALALLRGGACSNYREVSICANVLYAIVEQHDQARALAVLRYFLSHIPKELSADSVYDAMTDQGWILERAMIEKLLPAFAGQKFPFSMIDVAP